ncbi:MAG: phosphoribosylformylglycinamidine synthase I [Gammaproteobacteria bacterium]|nr:phosphoribosylformylglycinamidine synthase I [Gammaproteobacteria bacterium]
MIRIAIIQFPGSNCERETAMAVRRAGMEPVDFLWNASPQKLADLDGFVIVGGFSYEDRSRAGIIAAMDPVMQMIRTQSELGKPVLGICNGAQILVETGLVPGLPNHQPAVALTDNWRVKNGIVMGTGFYNAWVHMRLADRFQFNAFTRRLTTKDILHIPVAHAEGRFLIPPALLLEMRAQGMGVFQYCNASGEISDEFPVNPNGSVDNIAAITNRAGNVMAMMPHPERTSFGDPIFESMRDYIASGEIQKVGPLHYQPRYPDVKNFQLAKNQHEMIIGLSVTDNQAVSVENALRKSGIPAIVKRYTHWAISCDSPETFNTLKNSDILFNPRKEYLVTSFASTSSLRVSEASELGNLFFLIRAKNDLQGFEQQKHLSGIEAMHHGVLWHLETEPQYRDVIIDSHILFNPVAHDCYIY